MFLDASSIVAMLSDEEAGPRLEQAVEAGRAKITSPIAVWEAVAGLVSQKGYGVDTARALVFKFLDQAKVMIVPLTLDDLEGALDAYDRFGKGRHPARLNLGDCFAYAAARTHKARLLAVGNDFTLTDVKIAAW